VRLRFGHGRGHNRVVTTLMALRNLASIVGVPSLFALVLAWPSIENRAHRKRCDQLNAERDRQAEQDKANGIPPNPFRWE
jgi:hypothetical protein